MFKRIVPLVVALVLLVSCLLVSASAAPLDYNDYITDIQVDGNNDLVTVAFPLKYSAITVGDASGFFDSSFGTGNLTTTIQDDGDFYGYAMFYSLYNEYLDISNIPNGTNVVFTYKINLYLENSVVAPSALVPSGFFYVVYYNADYEPIGEPDVIYDEARFGQDFVSSFTLNKPTDAVAMSFYLVVSPLSFDASGRVYAEFSMKPTVLNMSISGLYREQQMTGKTNQILSAIEKKLEENGQKLDDIVNMPVTPTPPEGSDIVTDAGNKEDQLLQSGAAGRDEFNSLLGDSAVNIGLYASSFAFLSACINPFLDIPWIMQIITISLGLGLVGFLLNLGFTDISNRDVRKSSNSKKSARKSLTSSKALTKVGDK